jgi:hypothetical protein
MSPEEVRSCLAEEPPESEGLWRRAGALEGGFGMDTDAVIVLGRERDGWRPRIKWVYCDQSIWYSVWAAFRVRSKLDRSGPVENTSIEVVRLRGANHFVSRSRDRWEDNGRIIFYNFISAGALG